MLNPQFIGYDTENGVTLTTNFRKKEEETVIWTWEKGKQKTKKFSGLDDPQLSVQSEQTVQYR